MILIVEIDNFETAPIYIEMNISFLKIGGNSFPDLGNWKFSFNCFPSFESKTSTLLVSRDEEERQ